MNISSLTLYLKKLIFVKEIMSEKDNRSAEKKPFPCQSFSFNVFDQFDFRYFLLSLRI